MKKIFIADDSLTIQKIFKLTLESQGYLLKFFNAQEDLLNTLKKELPDLLFLDAHLPGLSIEEYLKKIKSWQLKILLITHEFDEFSLTQFQSLQVIDFLQRPFEPEKILQIIEKISSSIPLQEPQDWDMSIPGHVLDFNSKEKIPPMIDPTPSQHTNLELKQEPYQVHSEDEVLENLLKGHLREDIEKILWKIVPEITEKIVTKEIQQIKEDILKE